MSDDLPRRTTRERRLARAERLEEWAEKREVKATTDLARGREMLDQIPLGQPILTDHYSARRDTNYRNRASRTMDRGMEHARKAESMAGRAETIRAQADAAIYSDDDDAIPALAARIAALEAERDRIKAYNASCRKGTPDESLLDDDQRQKLASVRQHAAFQLGKGGAFPAYALSNLSGNIKRQRDRLARLRTQEATDGD